LNEKLDLYFEKLKHWKDEFTLLRAFILECNVQEDIKWRLPCYTNEGKNIVILQPFKEYCAVMFFKGVLLKDEQKVLHNLSENTQSARQIRFKDVEQIIPLKQTIIEYVNEAIELEKLGAKVEFKPTSEYDVPEEFQNFLENIPGLKDAFESLTPGRQRGYLLFFSSPKQSATKISRIQKSIPQILAGKGIND